MKSDCTAETIETPANDLIEELHAVRDSVEELYLLLDNIWRNRNEIQNILKELIEKKEEIIACCHCDASPPSLAVAIQEGWTDFQFDNGPEWDYLGICADCQREQSVVERQASCIVSKRDDQKKLF
ncbi:MAG: hypothetical protein ABSE63_10565 [Thermoguttaceae bacterium]|jgi:hypothetical protein